MIKSFLENTRIMPKLMTMILTLGLLATGISAYSAYRSTNIDGYYATLTDIQFPSTVELVRANRSVSEMIQEGYAAAVYSKPEEIRQAKQNMIENRDEAYATIRVAMKIDPSLAARGEDLDRKIDQAYQVVLKGVEKLELGQREEGLALLAESDQLNHVISKAMTDFNEERVRNAHQETETLQAWTAQSNVWTLSLSILCTVILGGAAWYVSRNGIVGPLLAVETNLRRLADGDAEVEVPCTGRRDEVGRMCRAVQVLRDSSLERNRLEREKQRADAVQKMIVDTLSGSLGELAAGDLTTAIDADFPGDYAALKTNFNAAVEQLRGLIGAVIASAEQLRTGSIEIAQASEDLARRTEGNAASLEQTAAGVQQMDGRLKATASAANDTVQRADQTKVTVASGRSVADQAVQAMVRVSDSAKGIDSVIEGLDKIAFQTRVLAMNAAVEAGRAGEAGRGFAVVADLVSALAMRAEEEAKRARDQLTVTQADVVTAVEAVEKVDGALANISGDVEQVHSLLATIAADNQAQAGAITEINAAVASMDQATQQNAAMVEETSAAARNLLAEVNALSEQAGQFTTGAPNTRTPRVPRVGKEGAFAQPVRALPAHAVAALTPPNDADDWREF